MAMLVDYLNSANFAATALWLPGRQTYIRKIVGRTGFEPVTFSVSGKIIGVMSWAGESLLCDYQQLCRWMSLTEALHGWQLAPRMAPILVTMRP